MRTLRESIMDNDEELDKNTMSLKAQHIQQLFQSSVHASKTTRKNNLIEICNIMREMMNPITPCEVEYYSHYDDIALSARLVDKDGIILVEAGMNLGKDVSKVNYTTEHTTAFIYIENISYAMKKELGPDYKRILQRIDDIIRPIALRTTGNVDRETIVYIFI